MEKRRVKITHTDNFDLCGYVGSPCWQIANKLDTIYISPPRALSAALLSTPPCRAIPCRLATLSFAADTSYKIDTLTHRQFCFSFARLATAFGNNYYYENRRKTRLLLSTKETRIETTLLTPHTVELYVTWIFFVNVFPFFFISHTVYFSWFGQQSGHSAAFIVRCLLPPGWQLFT